MRTNFLAVCGVESETYPRRRLCPQKGTEKQVGHICLANADKLVRFVQHRLDADGERTYCFQLILVDTLVTE